MGNEWKPALNFLVSLAVALGIYWFWDQYRAGDPFLYKAISSLLGLLITYALLSTTEG